MERRPVQKAELDWRDGDIPVSTRYGEAYFGAADALAEARHVFLAGNDLPARFQPGFHVAELGFGTGLNALAALLAWRAAGIGGTLRHTAFEAHPMAAAEMARALSPWAEFRDFAAALVGAWETGARRILLGDAEGGAIEIAVIEGDARETLPRWPGRADAWFLDGFSPARNPELWEPALFLGIAGRCRPGATAATYSAAGGVRAALAAAGFAVARAPGFGAKKHMTRARREADGPAPMDPGARVGVVM